MSETPDGGLIISLAAYRSRTLEGRAPLYVSHATGKATGPAGGVSPDFGDRLQRIRASLAKINRLMSELREMNATEEKLDDSWD